VVVFHHMNLAYHFVPMTNGKALPIRPLFAGTASVYIFFVLSGLVLFLSLANKDGFRYGPYIVKRMLRLYVPLASAVILSGFLFSLIGTGTVPGGSRWLNERSWMGQPGWGMVLANLALLDKPVYQGLDNVMWSLVHEIRISLIFPVLALCVIRWPRTTLALTAALSVVCFQWAPEKTEPITIDIVRTARYVFLFAAGAWMANNRPHVRAWFSDTRVAVAGLVIVWGAIGALEPTSYYSPWTYSGGALLLVAAIYGNARLGGMLEKRPLIWLGELSFSLYLVHLPVLLLFTRTLGGVIPPLAIVCLAMASALAAAHLFMIWVERPSLSLGRWATARIFYSKAFAA